MPKKQLKIYHLKYKGIYRYPIVLVLDPDEEKWERIYEISRKITEQLPDEVSKIFFLGNQASYNKEDFESISPSWREENNRRVALLNPIFEKLTEDNFYGLVVVITAKIPIDLDDWIEDEFIRHTIFITIGFGLKEYHLNQINGNLNISSIVKKIRDPIQDVWIEGKGFVPLAFEIQHGGVPHVVFQDNSGKFFLKIYPNDNETHLELHLKALSNKAPFLHLKWKGGEKALLKPKEEKPWIANLRWESLPDGVSEIVRAGIEKRDYTCPQCNRKHRYTVLICPEGGAVLQNIPQGVCVLFTKDKFLSFSENTHAIPVGENEILTKHGKIYKWQNGRWHELGEVQPYQEMDYAGNKVWALFHKIG